MDVESGCRGEGGGFVWGYGILGGGCGGGIGGGGGEKVEVFLEDLVFLVCLFFC